MTAAQARSARPPRSAHPGRAGRATSADPAVQALIDDMLATMVAADGIGLAAPQVHSQLRIIVALEIEDRASATRSRARAGQSRS